jgi:hypothetical protein
MIAASLDLPIAVATEIINFPDHLAFLPTVESGGDTALVRWLLVYAIALAFYVHWAVRRATSSSGLGRWRDWSQCA